MISNLNIFSELARSIGLSIPTEGMDQVEIPSAVLDAIPIPAPISTGQTPVAADVQRSTFVVSTTSNQTNAAPATTQLATFGKGLWRISAWAQSTSNYGGGATIPFAIRLGVRTGGTAFVIIQCRAVTGANIATMTDHFDILLDTDTATMDLFEGGNGVGETINANARIFCSKLL